MKIDFHSHFFPAGYLDKVVQWGGSYEYAQDATGLKIVKERFSGIVYPIETNFDERIAEMDRSGIDLQVLTLASPNVYFSTRKRNLYLAKLSNDYYAEICQRYPRRFIAFASVPLCHPEDAIAELHRAVKDLGMQGIALGTNIAGKYLHSKEFWPFYEEVNRLNLPIILHPLLPVHQRTIAEIPPPFMIDFIMDTTITVSKMVFYGVFEKYQKITLILPHLGGTLPFFFERIDMTYKAHPGSREHISNPPSEYLKRFYYDTGAGHRPALICTYYSVGADHIVLGSDYPFLIGGLSKSVSMIQELDIPSEEKEWIFGENGKKILKL